MKNSNTNPLRQRVPYESPATEIYGMETEESILTMSGTLPDIRDDGQEGFYE
jgi:hypothetical protein